MGGDEFLIALPASSLTNAYKAIERINNRIEKQNLKERNSKYKISVSYGFSSSVCYAYSTLDELIELADKDMYTNKKKTR